MSLGVLVDEKKVSPKRAEGKCVMKTRTTTLALVILTVAVFATLAQADIIQNIIQFDLGSAKGTAANWNEVTTHTVGTKISNAVNSTGGVTTVDFEITDAFTGTTSNPNVNGPYPNSVIQDALYLLSDPYGEVEIHGLNTAAEVTYNVTFYSTTDNSNERIIKWTIGAESVQLASYYNVSTVTIYGVKPDDNGTIVIGAGILTGAVAYWNSMVITELSSLQSDVQFDLGSGKGTVANWNEVSTSTVGAKIMNAVNSTGLDTTLDFEITDAFQGVTMNTVTGGPYPDNIIQDALYHFGGGYGEVEIHGFSTASGMTYNFTFYSTTASTGARIMKWTIGAESVQLDAENGNLSTVTISRVISDENGTIVIGAASLDNTTAYWNSLVVTGPIFRPMGTILIVQ